MKYFLILILLVGLSSCDLFSTREPELPTTSSITQVPASTPDILFGNFKSSIEEKIIDNYMVCFADPAFSSKKYTFTASAAAFVQYPVLTNWGIESERQYFNNLKTIIHDPLGRSFFAPAHNLIDQPRHQRAVVFRIGIDWSFNGFSAHTLLYSPLVFFGLLAP